MGTGSPSVKSILPSCWQDDVRMNMLFSGFRSQTVNPAGWQDKMNFWVNLITDYCHQTKCVVFTHEDLCMAFDRHGCVPQCLKAVIDHMLSQGSLMPLTDFNRIPPQKKSWLDWGYDVLLYRPVTWGLATFQSAILGSQRDDQYVMISVVKNLASKVHLRHKDLVNSQWTDNVVYLETLEEQCKDICTGMNLKLALTQLQKENVVVMLEMNGQWVAKFRGKEETAVAPFSELDQGILRLQKAKDTIQKEVDKADYEINSCLQEAKHFVKTGIKTKAMLCLKRKKRLEKLLEKKVASLDNIENLLSQLQNSSSEKMVLQAYNAGVSAMKCAVKGGLDLDDIDTTMADVEEMLDAANEIQDVLGKPVSSTEQDLSGLEEELEELLASDKNVEDITTTPTLSRNVNAGDPENALNKLLDLPAPPTNLSPISSRTSAETNIPRKVSECT